MRKELEPYIHPSNKLKAKFEDQDRRFQGGEPKKARFLFVGRDANFDQGIETKKIFKEIMGYLDNGPCWWRKNRVHHPFMLGLYNGKGKPYHEEFKKIGFTPEDADLVSFVELFHLPTTGSIPRNLISPVDLCPDHVDWLVEIFDKDPVKHIFLQGEVYSKVGDGKFEGVSY
jgi:hypothetical protein